jgi:hypothetical protein
VTQPYEADGFWAYSPKMRSQALVRKQISQGGSGYVGLAITGSGEYVDADDISVSVFRRTDFSDDSDLAVSPLGKLEVDGAIGDAIVRDAVGRYHYDIGVALTGQKAHLTVVWKYTVAEAEYSFTDYLAVVEPMPFYETLQPFEKSIVEQVLWMFGDLFDSTTGGPHLVEPFQTHFGYERIAQLMAVAVQRMNVMAQPITRWGIGPGVSFPEPVTGLVLMGTYIEVLKHLMRAYVEQPDFKNMQVTYTDRRDYLQRWQTIYQDEKADFAQALKQVKRSFLSLGRGSLLVSGGIFGGGAKGPFIPGIYAAQVRSYRFYPAAPAISWANAHMETPGPWQQGQGN